MYNHACNYITVEYQQIVYGGIANQIHGFTIGYGTFVLMKFSAILGVSVFNCHMKFCYSGTILYNQ